jgi:WD40 repeat protein
MVRSFLKRLPLVLVLAAGLAASWWVWGILPVRPRVAWADARGAQFTPDGKTFITFKGDRLTLNDSATGKEQAFIATKQPGYDEFSNHPFLLSPDGELLAVRTEDGGLSVYDVPALTRRAVLGAGSFTFTGFDFSPDSRFLTGIEMGKPDGYETRVWDLTTGRQLPPSLCPGPTVVTFSPDGKRMALFSALGGPPDVTVRETSEPWRVVARGPYRLPTFSPDGSTLAVVRDADIILLDAATGEEGLKLSPVANGAVYTLSFHPDGSSLAAGICPKADPGVPGQEPGELTVFWELPGGREVAVLPHQIQAFFLHFKGSGRVLVTLHDGELRATLWDVQGLPPRQLCRVEDSRIIAPDGRTLSAVGTTPSASFFRAAVTPLGMPQQSPAVSPDGRFVTFCQDCDYQPSGLGSFLATVVNQPLRQGTGTEVRLVDLDKGREVAALSQSGGPLFSPDGLTLATDDIDNSTVMLWDVPPPKAYPWLAALPAVAALAVVGLVGWHRGRQKKGREAVNLPDPVPEVVR